MNELIDTQQEVSEVEFKSKMLWAKHNVNRLLTRFPYLADDYNALVLFFWHYVDNSWKYISMVNGRPYISTSDTKYKLTPLGTIERVFREIKHEALFICEDCGRTFTEAKFGMRHSFKFKHNVIENPHLIESPETREARETQYHLFRNYYAKNNAN